MEPHGAIWEFKEQCDRVLVAEGSEETHGIY
jgi:hypothetical protein